MTTLTRWRRPELSWSPFRHLSTLRDEIDRLFESPLSGLSEGSFGGGWLPAVDLYEEKDNFVLKAELPGMKKDDIEISLHNGLLTLSGERKYEEKVEGTETYRSERFFGRFHRTLSLPTAVDADKVVATYKDGILTVMLPKTEEAKARHIPVTLK